MKANEIVSVNPPISTHRLKSVGQKMGLILRSALLKLKVAGTG